MSARRPLQNRPRGRQAFHHVVHRYGEHRRLQWHYLLDRGGPTRLTFRRLLTPPCIAAQFAPAEHEAGNGGTTAGKQRAAHCALAQTFVTGPFGVIDFLYFNLNLFSSTILAVTLSRTPRSSLSLMTAT